ncbi:MAG: hypothetical protein QOI20_2690 [Acidimicrobiaceae bacterium]|jgi:hypothetical protein|nr:hypothetical protein [Acidimicrobiaceae bacterium]
MASAHVLDMASTGTLVMAAAAATVCVARWRAGAEAAVLFMATAVLVYGVMVKGMAALLLPRLLDGRGQLAGVAGARGAGLLATGALVVLAVARPDADTARRATGAAGAAVVASVALGLVLDRVPGVASVLAFGRRGLVGGAMPTVAHRLVWAAVWTLPGVVLLARGLGRPSAVTAWSGGLLVTLAAGHVVAVGAARVDGRVVGGEVVEALAFALLLVGVTIDFERALLDQRARLFDSMVAIRAERTRAQVGSLVHGRRRHDLANAVMGLEGSAATLDRHYDRLDAEDRRRLAKMMATSVERLRELSLEDPIVPTVYPVADATEALCTALAEAGMDVAFDADGPSDLVVRALPEEMAEVLGQVVTAVQDERPSGPVRVVAAGHGRGARLSVEFRPGGRRARGRNGGGVSLSVAARLLEERDGRLLVEGIGADEVAIRMELPEPA